MYDQSLDRSEWPYTEKKSAIKKIKLFHHVH